jgi:group II intron reverse transcriptase/maturase
VQSGVRIKHLFRIMTHYPDLWMEAYANIYANRGAITKGVDDNTLDGMCVDRIENLIKILINGQYVPKPVKRVYIPKKNGKSRPLGVPTGDDKLVQEVVKMLLQHVYEPVFSDKSHGFRPNRSCHTALTQVKQRWKGAKWVVDMDIKGFFDNLNHNKLIAILERKIDDKKFIQLIKSLLQAGYLDDWKFHKTYTGTPQGGICSPILANIVLHELDQFMEQKAKMFDRGTVRNRNPAYYSLQARILLRRKKLKLMEESGDCFPLVISGLRNELQDLENMLRSMPSNDVKDDGFKRLYYVRYADDFAIGLIGSKQDAENIAEAVKQFLQKELALETAQDKGGIHHIQDGFDFLGHHISLSIHNGRLLKRRCGTNKNGTKTYGTQRTLSSQLQLQLPLEKVWEFCRNKRYLRDGNPTHRLDLIHLSDYEIVATFNAEMRGFANFYALAPRKNLSILEWAGLSSMFCTLAHKHKTSSLSVRRKMKQGDEHVLRYQVNSKHKTLTVFKVKHAKRIEVEYGAATQVDQLPKLYQFNSRSELIARMNANQCEYCGKAGGYFEVHHIRKLKDLQSKRNLKPWEALMSQRNRKTMVLCFECHQQLHLGTLQGWKRNLNTEVESVVR